MKVKPTGFYGGPGHSMETCGSSPGNPHSPNANPPSIKPPSLNHRDLRRPPSLLRRRAGRSHPHCRMRLRLRCGAKGRRSPWGHDARGRGNGRTKASDCLARRGCRCAATGSSLCNGLARWTSEDAGATGAPRQSSSSSQSARSSSEISSSSSDGSWLPSEPSSVLRAAGEADSRTFLRTSSKLPMSFNA